MKTFLLCIAAVLMTACATSPSTRSAEIAWQTMNAIDMGQTLHIASEPSCFKETNALTKALIGDHPSKKEVILSSVLYAVGHAAITGWLDRRTDRAFVTESPNRGLWYVGRIAYHGLSLGTKTWQINHNNNIGLKPFGRGCMEQLSDSRRHWPSPR